MYIIMFNDELIIDPKTVANEYCRISIGYDDNLERIIDGINEILN